MIALNSSVKNKGRERISYLTNAALWLVPFLIYALLDSFMLKYELALLIATAVGLCVMALVRNLYVKKVFPFYLYISDVVFVLCLLVSPLIASDENFLPYLLPDLLVSLCVALVMINKRRVIRLMDHVERRFLPFPLRSGLYEFFVFSKLFLIVELSYMVLTAAYLLFLRDYHTPELHRFFFGTLHFSFFLLLILFCHTRLYLINRCFQTEEWLPIINESGTVIGKVARHISYQEHAKYLHPHIRVLIFSHGRIFLSVCSTANGNHGLHDTPLSHDMFYSQTFASIIAEVTDKIGIFDPNRARFFTRYLYKSPSCQRIMFLYTLIVSDEEVHSLKYFRRGKFWTEQEIELNLHKGVFTKVFEEEYELLRDTVFPVIKMMC